ncbi:MAG: acylneuraminate cytidylyltransferase family protein [Desulfarculaceae bacterium]|nr:acylneuraminate cytidylyltransferase family protein [Desulfarculaceae bacterium]MCF8072925.1 acylneuraminate cytidylyltransferase family protein [Desulfarculaceae bacterium]MCF8101093.1 acylneuraminate cytidylyltransferase family protein [Desulfarculaceae bacterium]MCF8115520.1 acylneuraminate cytidylyltransferase family protein [Desulfarculaceae bacterium]
MSASPKVLAVIPARGGSKGVPRKNIRLVGGKPLIAWTIECALAARGLFHRVIVSTDDSETADIARQHGAEVPFMRPDDLARDKSPTLPVLRHAVDFVEQQDGVTLDWVMLLQPTAPLKEPADLEAALELAGQGGCDSVISVVQVFDVHPVLMKRIEDELLQPFCVEEAEGTRRQDYSPPAYMRNGAIYLTRREALMEQGSIWGRRIRPYVMPEQRSLSIDNEWHIKMADVVLSEKKA